MNCTNCGSEIKEDAKFCAACGAVVSETKALETETPVVVAEPVYQAPNQPSKKENKIPEKYSPLSPWSYFWLQILFAVPVVGFIFLIIFSFKNSNINRRNFARSYWCKLIIVAGIFIVMLIITLVLGVSVGGLFRMSEFGSTGAGIMM